MRIAIQIPCLNEEETLPSVIADVRQATHSFKDVIIIIIDDGSTDRTVDVAFEAGADFVAKHGRNEGLALAYQTGLATCINLGADIIVNIDADNQYSAFSIPRVVEPIIRNTADLVVGARPIDTTEHFSWLKKKLQRLGSFVARKLSGTDVEDATSGFRAISRSAALRLNSFSRYTYTLETLIQAGRSGVRVATVPVDTNGPTRPSRLISSVRRYVGRSARDMILIFTIYAPFTSYFVAGTVPLFFGALLALRYVVSVTFLDPTRSHTPSLIAASVLFGSAFLLWSIGVLGELLSVNRRLLEDMRLARRRAEAAEGKLSGRCDYDLLMPPGRTPAKGAKAAEIS